MIFFNENKHIDNSQKNKNYKNRDFGKRHNVKTSQKPHQVRSQKYSDYFGKYITPVNKYSKYIERKRQDRKADNENCQIPNEDVGNIGHKRLIIKSYIRLTTIRYYNEFQLG